ncbi:hypothetical protein AQ436_06665 [Arthrobacter sp. EpRS66]|nr:hypothetical protein AQ436_06665 [Arthrobacter sp. EpRS66]
MQGSLNLSGRAATVKLRVAARNLPPGASVTVTDVMLQPGGAASGWIPHTTELPWAAGMTGDDVGGGGPVYWDEILGKPSQFPPMSHTHSIAQVSGLQAALDGKQAAGDYATNAALSSGLAGKANTSHTHSAAQTTSGVFALARIPTMDTAHIADASVTSPKLSSELANRLSVIESDLAVTSGLVTLTDTANFAAYAAGQEPRAVKKAGFVTITGAMRLLTAGYIDSGAGRVFGKLPAGMEPGGNTTLAFVSQASNNDRFSLLVTADGRVGASRYGPASSPVNAWLNIGITYQQVVT